MDCILKTLDDEISLDYIKKIGILINRDINEIDGFRTTPVYITGAEHIPPEASYIPQLLSQILYHYRQSNSGSDIFEKIADMHIRFEWIHPFIDGNVTLRHQQKAA